MSTKMSNYYPVHKFFVVDGNIVLSDLIEWPEVNQEMLTTDIANDDKHIFPIRTGMIRAGVSEFTFNKTKDVATSADTFLYPWRDKNEYHQVNVIETDALGDPFNPSSVVGNWDYGLCGITTCKEPAGTKESPNAAKITVAINHIPATFRRA
jgi:hypothetical protein